MNKQTVQRFTRTVEVPTFIRKFYGTKSRSKDYCPGTKEYEYLELLYLDNRHLYMAIQERIMQEAHLWLHGPDKTRNTWFVEWLDLKKLPMLPAVLLPPQKG